MKNRIFVSALSLLLIFGTGIKSYAQQRIESSAQNGFVPVRTYLGVSNSNTFGYRIHLYGYNINIPDWSLRVRVDGQIRNGEGKILDPTKLKININRITPEPTLDQIGTSNPRIPLSRSATPIFSNSKFPLFTTSGYDYKQIFISFDLHVDGGAYLEALKSWNQYTLNVVFSVHNRSGQLVTEAPIFVNLQIHPDDTPPSGPTYSLQVMGGAASGILEFMSSQDFETGIQQSYPKGLSVISSTPYQLQVRTLTDDFISNSLTVPVNTVQLHLKSSVATSSTKQGTIALSSNPQTIISNETSTGSQARLYDIRYFTLPNDLRLLKAVPANYQTTLMYTITPQ